MSEGPKESGIVAARSIRWETALGLAARIRTG